MLTCTCVSFGVWNPPTTRLSPRHRPTRVQSWRECHKIISLASCHPSITFTLQISEIESHSTIHSPQTKIHNTRHTTYNPWAPTQVNILVPTSFPPLQTFNNHTILPIPYLNPKPPSAFRPPPPMHHVRRGSPRGSSLRCCHPNPKPKTPSLSHKRTTLTYMYLLLRPVCAYQRELRPLGTTQSRARIC